MVTKVRFQHIHARAWITPTSLHHPYSPFEHLRGAQTHVLAPHASWRHPWACLLLVSRAPIPLQASSGARNRVKMDHVDDDEVCMPRHKQSKRKQKHSKKGRHRAAAPEEDHTNGEDDYSAQKANLIEEALAFSSTPGQMDAEELRLLALQDGGLLTNNFRQLGWPILLQVNIKSVASKIESLVDAKTANQIKLDCARSYSDQGPQAIGKRAKLQTLLMRFFARNPDLNYYQGFHDVAEVVSEVFEDQSEQLQMLASISRSQVFLEAHAPSFTTIEQLLATIKELLAIVDLELTTRFGDSALWGISMLITGFSHDVPDKASRLRLFDAILASHPSFLLYLVAAVPLIPDVRPSILSSDDMANAHSAVREAVRSIHNVHSADLLIRAARDLYRTVPPERLLREAELNGLKVRDSIAFRSSSLHPSWIVPPRLTTSEVTWHQVKVILRRSRWTKETLIATGIVIIAVVIALQSRYNTKL